MADMTLTAESVAAASAAWIWVPDGASIVEGDGYAVMRLPDYFDYQLSVLLFQPSGALGEAVDVVLEQARTFGLPELRWQVRADEQAGLAAELAARGGTPVTALDVLASDLTGTTPTLPPPAVDVELRWATDFATARDGAEVGVTGFGGGLPPDDRIKDSAARDAETVPQGGGGMVVAYVDGQAAGSGGVTMVDGVARLWGGAVVPSARRRGVYRAVLATRLSYAAAHGGTMALVRAKVDTSGPILRRAGFTAFGREVEYRVPL
jgi:GNAT superfamily N-acetyltransferase